MSIKIYQHITSGYTCYTSILFYGTNHHFETGSRDTNSVMHKHYFLYVYNLI